MIRRVLSGASAAWANMPIRSKGLVVVAIPMAALLVVVLTYVASERASQEAVTLVTRTQDIRASIQQVSNILLDANSGVRDYLLTGQESFLTSYDGAIRALPDEIAALARLVRDDAGQSERMHRITAIVEQDLDTLTTIRYAPATASKLTGRQREALAQ